MKWRWNPLAGRRRATQDEPSGERFVMGLRCSCGWSTGKVEDAEDVARHVAVEGHRTWWDLVKL